MQSRQRSACASGAWANRVSRHVRFSRAGIYRWHSGSSESCRARDHQSTLHHQQQPAWSVSPYSLRLAIKGAGFSTGWQICFTPRSRVDPLSLCRIFRSLAGPLCWRSARPCLRSAKTPRFPHGQKRFDANGLKRGNRVVASGTEDGLAIRRARAAKAEPRGRESDMLWALERWRNT
jgi:hypothetical protein